jgi:hypothetical protein|uniref:PcfJ like protein n=1 Tax=Myoviridae sp. ct78050 TaxID=2826617 RepID=A0A8S5R242_9CAUD|nr:MAG TPA: PcfJ like protein [Myoviridae sp. ct78050]
MEAGKSILERLKTRKLTWPKGIEEFIFSKMDLWLAKEAYSRTYFVETLEIYYGKLLKRIFGFQLFKNPNHSVELKIQEVARYIEGEKKFLVGNLYCGMFGKRVDFDYPLKFWISDSKLNFYPLRMYSVEDWIKLLNIPYCQYQSELNQSGLDFFDYVCAYRKEPKIEYLVKADLSQFISSLRVLDLSQKSLDKIFKVDRKFVPLLPNMDYTHLMLCRNYPWASEEGLLEIRKLKFKHIRKYMCPRVLSYAAQIDDWNINLYEDYLKFAETIGADMKSYKVLTPSNLVEAHDAAYKSMRATEDARFEQGILDNYEKHVELCYSNGKYLIRPVKTNAELKKESEVLNHCVRTYAADVSKGHTEIMFVRLNDNPNVPLYTLELKQKVIKQFRADHNAVPPDDAFSFVREWADRFKLDKELIS